MPTIAVTRERRAGETRVAAVPETVKKLIAQGFAVTVEAGAGAGASYADADYAAAGASLAKTAKDALAKADILFKVRAPEAAEIAAVAAAEAAGEPHPEAAEAHEAPAPAAEAEAPEAEHEEHDLDAEEDAARAAKHD